MDESFKVYVRRLQGGAVESLHEVYEVDPVRFEGDEVSLSPIKVEGSCYLASQELIIRLQLSATAVGPCVICNQPAKAEVVVSNLYKTVPLSDISGDIYDLSEDIEEGIVLEIPQFFECNRGQCAHRLDVEKFLVKNSTKEPAGQSLGDLL